MGSLRGADGDHPRDHDDGGDDGATLVVTGFGKFAGVPENPTTRLVAELKKRRPQLLARVLETSMVGVRQGLDELGAELEARGARPEDAVWIHMGVYSSSPGFRLEHVAYNEASFRAPDERGEMPSRQKIAPEGPAQISCGFDLAALCSEVRARVDAKARVNVTDDPGRFVCNYVYYSSLLRHGPHVLFLHVPSFDTAEPELQLSVVEAVLDAIPATRLRNFYASAGALATARLVLGDEISEDERRAWVNDNKEEAARVLTSFQELNDARTSQPAPESGPGK